MTEAAAAPWDAWRGAAFMDPGVQAGLMRIGAWMETGAVFISLVLFSQAMAVFYPTTVLAEDQPLLRALWYPVYLFALLACAARPRRTAQFLMLNALAFAPVIMALMSTQWSLLPDITFRRAVALAFTMLFGVYLAQRYSWRALLLMLAAVFGFLAVASVVTVAVNPARGIMQMEFPGAWQGLFAQKNELGSMMARGALAFAAVLALYADKRRNVLLWGGLLLCVGLVLMSTSKTSLLAAIAIPCVMLAIVMLRRGAVSGFVFACLAGLAVTAVAGVMIWDIDLFFEMLGKERSLTGRTDIWASLAERIAERPWLGYGYGVFWRDPWGPVYWVRLATQWQVPSAHNGWLETALALGLIGTALTALYMLAAAVVGFFRIWTRPETLYALPYIALTLLFSVSESNILQHNNLAWVIFVAVAAKLFVPREARDLIPAGPGPTPAPANDRGARMAGKPGAPGRAGHSVNAPLTLFRVTLRPGASMIDLSADLAGLAAGLDRTRPADGRGRVIMFTAPRTGMGVSLLSREFARMMARRAPRGVWLFDLDLARNEHFKDFSGGEARQRYGPIGSALDATLGVDPFWRITSGRAEDDAAENPAALLTLHRVGTTRLFVSRFHPELLTRGKRVHIRAAHSYWERLRDTVELAVIDAPATERSFAGRPLYGEADAVVIVIDGSDESMREAELLAETVRDRGGMPAGVIVNMVTPAEDEFETRRAS